MDRRKVLIVDDELPALNVLVALAKRRPELEIVLATTDFQEAWDYLDTHDIDILIVDLDLRVASGYRLMGVVEPPAQIIVCTASKEEGSHAIQAGAVDFLTKMVEASRFNSAIDRAVGQLVLLEKVEKYKVYPSTILVPVGAGDGEVHHNIEVNRLVYARSEGKTTCLFLDDGTNLLANRLLLEIQGLLDPHRFIRVQKGFMVNREAIATYVPGTAYGTKNWWIVLREKFRLLFENEPEKGRLPVGDRFRYRVERLLGVRD